MDRDRQTETQRDRDRVIERPKHLSNAEKIMKHGVDAIHIFLLLLK